jgi:hypothetical protein
LKTTLRTVLLSLLLSAAAAFAGVQPKYQIALFYKQAASVQYDASGNPFSGTGYYAPIVLNDRDEVIAESQSGGYHDPNLQTLPVSIKGGVAHVHNEPPFNAPPFGINIQSLNDSGAFVGDFFNESEVYSFIVRPSGPAAGVRRLPAEFLVTAINNQGAIAGLLDVSTGGFIYQAG